MRAAPTKCVIMGAVCLIVSVVAVCLCLRSKEPTYDGQRLSYWFHELPVTMIRPGSVVTMEAMTLLGRNYGRQRVNPSVSVSAIQGIGSDRKTR